MIDISAMAPVLAAGILLGFMFYGGLWLTVRQGLNSAYAYWWFFGSFWLRLLLAVAGFYIVAQGDWKNLLVCLVSFMVGRLLVRVLTRETIHAA